MTKKLSDPDVIALLGKDGLFRFAYVPFVVAAAVWDHVDDAINQAANMRLDCKALCRSLRELNRDYDRLRARFICSSTLDRESENMEAFIDQESGYFAGLRHTLRNELSAQFPDLSEESRMFLSSVYSARVLCDALLRYVEAERERVAKLVGHPIGRPMPPQIYILAELLPQLVGDCCLLPGFDDNDRRRRGFVAVYDSFVRALTNKINAIQLNDTEPTNP